MISTVMADFQTQTGDDSSSARSGNRLWRNAQSYAEYEVWRIVLSLTEEMSSASKIERQEHRVWYHQFLVSTDLGGAGAVALRLGCDLRQAGYPIRIWIPGPGPAYQETVKTGLMAHSFNP